MSKFESDIPLSLAIAAHAGTSFSPETRGAQRVKEYADTLQQDYEHFKSQAEKGGTLDLLDAEFERYRAGYRARYRAYLASSGRCVSSFIAGPSNFPAARMNKRADIAHKRLNEVFEFRDRARKAILRTLRPDLRPIMSGDSDAVERLEAELAKAERLQSRMKECNAAIRSNRKLGADAQVAALVVLGITPARARDLLEPDFCGRIGFADYQLTNNGANIRRMKQRLESITAAKALPTQELESANGIRIEDDPPANRVRVFFPGKPDEETRSKLKSNGFRWSPTIGAWQAYRKQWTLDIAKGFING